MTGIITLRAATMKDADLLLNWRNDLETRLASHNTTKVERDEHFSWLSATLKNPSRKILIAEENGSPVGSVRVDSSEDAKELSWTVAPNARGRGVAKKMVAMVANNISEAIRAEVKTGNAASVRIAEQAGMELHKEANGILYYTRAQKNII